LPVSGGWQRSTKLRAGVGLPARNAVVAPRVEQKYTLEKIRR
jgi:hypothetical protein